MRFASSMENLGLPLIEAFLKLISFVPILIKLSEHVTEIPLIGVLQNPLLVVAIGWSLLGTGCLGLLGIKLPGLEFENQKVEAAFRKELVYGEDDSLRAAPITMSALFADIRKNYFRLYFHYFYFNFARQGYSYSSTIFLMFVMVPTIMACKITFGMFSQINWVFFEVTNSFQYLINSWPQVVDMMSVYKRINQFEQAID